MYLTACQKKARQPLHNILQGATKAGAGKAFDLFIKTYEPEYPKGHHLFTKGS